MEAEEAEQPNTKPQVAQIAQSEGHGSPTCEAAEPKAAKLESRHSEAAADAENGTVGTRLRKLATIKNFAAIMLTICALTTAWATWISDLHGSDQDSNYAYADRLNTEANASYNLNAQTYIAAFNVWSYVYQENAAIQTLEASGDAQSAESRRENLNSYIETNCPDYQNFKQAIYTALEKGGTATPFDEYSQESFFSESEQLATQATQVREDGNWNNLASDSFGLVSLLYSLCLFLFGMVGFYKELSLRRVVFFVGFAVFVCTTVYMFSLPMPKNFDFANYFSFFK